MRVLRASPGARDGRPAGRAGRRSTGSGGHRRARREDPDVQLPAGTATGSHRVSLTKNNLPAILAGELDEFTATLQGEEKRRALEAAEPVGRRPLRPTVVRTGMTVGDAVDAAATAIEAAGASTPRLDAELPVADAVGIDRAKLFMDPDREVPPPAARVLSEKRGGVQREPVAWHPRPPRLPESPWTAGIIPRPGDRASPWSWRSSRPRVRAHDVGIGRRPDRARPARRTPRPAGHRWSLRASRSGGT